MSLSLVEKLIEYILSDSENFIDAFHVIALLSVSVPVKGRKANQTFQMGLGVDVSLPYGMHLES